MNATPNATPEILTPTALKTIRTTTTDLAQQLESFLRQNFTNTGNTTTLSDRDYQQMQDRIAELKSLANLARELENRELMNALHAAGATTRIGQLSSVHKFLLDESTILDVNHQPKLAERAREQAEVLGRVVRDFKRELPAAEEVEAQPHVTFSFRSRGGIPDVLIVTAHVKCGRGDVARAFDVAELHDVATSNPGLAIATPYGINGVEKLCQVIRAVVLDKSQAEIRGTGGEGGVL